MNKPNDVVSLKGFANDDSIRAIANAININADILKDVLIRIEKLEQETKEQ